MSRIVECRYCDGSGFQEACYICGKCGGCGTVVEDDPEPDDNLDDYIEDEGVSL